QKLALNRITTAAMVLAGRVAGNHMIDLTGSTQKLQARAIRIVMDLGGLDEVNARPRLEAAGWSVRAALQPHPRRPDSPAGGRPAWTGLLRAAYPEKTGQGGHGPRLPPSGRWRTSRRRWRRRWPSAGSSRRP